MRDPYPPYSYDLNHFNNYPDLSDRFLRKEEYCHFIGDSYKRFQYWASNDRNIFRPSVSDILLNQGIITPEYPDGCEFTLFITHDIDKVFKPVKPKITDSARSLLRKNWARAYREITSIPDRKVPFFNFQEILALESKYDVKSTWFFKALEPCESAFMYHLKDVSDAFNLILDAGGEVGLHGGFSAPDNIDQLQLEKKRLEQVLGKKVLGYRSHYLKFSVPSTWEILSQAGFSYDSTLGYSDCVGFRNGMCHPFRPINLNTDKEINIIEIPLHVMDASLFKYMRLSPEGAWNLVRGMIDAVHNCHGVVVVNWHNTGYLPGSDERKIIEKIMQYCYEKKAWMGEMINL